MADGQLEQQLEQQLERDPSIDGGFYQFLPLSLTSAVFCLLTASGFSDPDFSIEFLAFTCFLGTTMFTNMIMIMAPYWAERGLPDEILRSRMRPVGQASYILFIVGTIFAFVTVATRQRATSTIVICSLMFVSLFSVIGYWFYLLMNDIKQKRIN